ncbi:MAG: hypothetical protein M1839_000904 [Geoglossum umbratile]|nr:MAG: hypothetical protein M1839_000904 [Geoglossum umbratile]
MPTQYMSVHKAEDTKSASQVKNIRRKSKKFRLTETGLIYEERNGSVSRCILQLEVKQVLKHLHDGCRHFADAITVNHAVGQFYWPKSKACKLADGKTVIDFFENHIALNFGYPYSLYTDNGSHFVGALAADFFEDKGIFHYDAPISHPSSVGLVERMVQLVLNRTRAYCIENQQNDPEPEYVQDSEEYAPHLYRLYVERRDELQEEAWQTMAAAHQQMEGQRNPVYTRPKEGDLVLLWNAQIGGQRGWKLESHWSEPYRLVKINPGCVTGMVSKLYGDGSQRRIHLDDMKVYCPWSIYPDLITTHATVSYTRDIMKYAGWIGQRALDLSQ